MATEEEIAERQRLISEINSLTHRINRALVDQENLETELAFVISAIAALTVAAEKMSHDVTQDVSVLNKKVAREDLDARDLLQQLRDLSERYFKYKHLSTATKELTQYTDEYYTRFEFYHELRRIALGCVMAVDANIISHATARTNVEKAYLANTDYWLAYAISAVMLWWSDEEAAATRAMKKALLMDERKSSLFFLFCNLKFGRKEAAANWYRYYLGTIHANDVGEEYQYLLEAYLSGAFGNAHKLEREVGSKFDDMLSEVTLYDINFDKEVASSAQRFLETKAHATDFGFFYLAEYCDECNDLKSLLASAEKNAIVAREYEVLAQGEDSFENVDERLEDSIYNLIESMDGDEQKVFLRIKRNELIVAAKGDVSVAEAAYAERYPAPRPKSLGDLMRGWAFTENDPRVLPEVRRFALGHLAPNIRAGFRQFAESYRAEERERYTVRLGEWSFSCNESEQDIAAANYAEYYDRHRLLSYAKDKFILLWSALMLLGIVGIVVAAAAFPHPSLIVISVLLVLAGGFLLWRQIANVGEALKLRKAKDLSIIRTTLDEMGGWRAAYRAADKGAETLLQATYLFED